MSRFDLKSLVIGFLAALLLAVCFGAERPASPGAWPPSPEQMVNVVRRFGDLKDAERDKATLLTVPADKWLIVTDIEATETSLDSGLAEMSGGAEIARWAGPFTSYHSSTGLAFHPGSSVVGRRPWSSISISGYYVSSH